ncbi:Hypothetical protein D9617_1g086170 [Elsinoe fawcettii]|nr:Hypothetical protein D9617_1g086170 [Elsinoe fawcettii]
MPTDGEDNCRSIGSQDTDLDQDFDVEEVIAARKFNGEVKYLVKWDGYDYGECTWEPRESFHDPETITRWKQRREKIKAGEIKDVDVEGIKRQMAKCKEDRLIRQERRARLRQSRLAKGAKRSLRSRGVAVKNNTSRKAKLDRDDSADEFGSPRKRPKLGKTRKVPTPVLSDSEDDLSVTPSSSTQSVTATDVQGTAGARELSLKAIKSSVAANQELEIELDVNGLTSESATDDGHLQHVPIHAAPQAQMSDHVIPDQSAPAEAQAQDKGGDHQQTHQPTTEAARPDLNLFDDESAISDGSLFGGSTQDDPPDTSVARQPRIDTAIPRSTDHSLPAPTKVDSTTTDYAPKTHSRARRTAINMSAGPVKRRSRPQLGKDAGPAQESKTWSLKYRNGYSKFALDNEAPDASWLDSLDVKTGHFIQSVQSLDHIAGTDITFDSRRDSLASEDERRKRLWGEPRTDQPSTYDRRRTCRRWLKIGHCEGCQYAHELTDEWQEKSHATCQFWLQGNCKFVDELCDRYHCKPDDRGVFPPSPTPARGSYSAGLRKQLSKEALRALTVWDIEDHRRANDRGPVAKASAQKKTAPTDLTYGEKMQMFFQKYGRPPARNGTTCRFWYRGTCKHLNDAECEFAHQPLPFIAPKMSKTCVYWQQGHCDYTEADCQFHHCPADAYGQPSSFKYHRTCAKWVAGHCEQDAETCDRYHVIWDPTLRARDKANATVALDAPGDLSNGELFEPGDLSDGELFEPASINSVLHFGSEDGSQFPISILLADSSLLQTTSPAYRTGELVVSVTCLAMDLSALLPSPLAISHEAFVTARDPEAIDALYKFGDHLSASSVGAVAHVGRFMIVIHAAHDATWDHFHNSARTTSNIGMPDNALALLAFDLQSLPAPAQTPVGSFNNGEEVMDMVPKDSLGDIGIEGSTIERLFAIAEDKMLQKLTFLMFPPNLHEEIGILRSILEEQGVTVCTPLEKGSWKTQFLDKALSDKPEDMLGGVLIWHEAVRNIWAIPRLLPTLHRSSFNHFRLHYSVIDAAGTIRRHWSLSRLFPWGYAALLTDEVFVQDPQGALQIIKHLDAEMTKSGQEFIPPSCIYVRPGILDFISDLLNKSKSDKIKAKYYQQLGQLMTSMVFTHLRPDADLVTDDEDDDKRPMLKIPSSDELPDYHSLAAKEPSRAVSQLIDHFSQWTLTQVENLRKFSVILPKYGDPLDGVMSDGEHEEAFGNVTTPCTPRANDSRRRFTSEKRVSGDETLRAKRWQGQYNHIYFLTTDKFVAQMIKK